MTYSEGIYVGYRHFDKAHIAPVFPFGYGLSYTTFRYSHRLLTPARFGPNDTVSATAEITNTGSRAGSEVAELYVHDPTPKIDKPIHELKGFSNAALMPGQTKQVSMTLTGRSFAYCDVAQKEWKADAGVYDVQIGASSRDIRLEAPVRLMSDYTQSIPDMGWTPPTPDFGIAVGKTVTASSVEQNPNNNLNAENVVDTDPATRCGSAFSDPQWIDIDLGLPKSIDKVKLAWEDACACAYQIQVSLDNQCWTAVYDKTAGIGGAVTIKFPSVLARYVRMYGTKRATQYGYSLYTFGVYAAP